MTQDEILAFMDKVQVVCAVLSVCGQPQYPKPAAAIPEIGGMGGYGRGSGRGSF